MIDTHRGIVILNPDHPNRQIKLPPQTQVVGTWGTITNHRQLCQAQELPPDSPPSELIASLYHRHNTRLASLLHGDAAGLIWDASNNKLVFFRDRIGQRPFYYAKLRNHAWLFSDEICHLIDHDQIETRINEPSIVHYLIDQAPGAGQTCYQGIHSVPPGTVLQICPAKIKLTTYWKKNRQPALKLKSDEAYAQAYLSVLNEVTQDYAVTGKQGITLTSGLDASSVAYSLRQKNCELRSVSFGSSEFPQADETALILQSAHKLGIPASFIDASDHWTMSAPEGIKTAPESPIHLYYTELMSALFAHAAKQEIDILFTGFSGDHLFGGKVTPFADLLLQGSIVELIKELFCNKKHRRWSIHNSIRSRILGQIIRSYFPGVLKPPLPQQDWLGDKSLKLINRHDMLATERAEAILPGRHSRLQLLKDPTIESMVQKINQLAGQAGVQLKHPLIDHRLIEFAASLPSIQTFKNGYSKYLVRNALRDQLPEAVVSLRKKIVPTAFFEKGMLHREVDKVQKLMTGMRAHELGFVDENKLRIYHQEFLSGKTNLFSFWNAICLEDWLRRHFN